MAPCLYFYDPNKVMCASSVKTGSSPDYFEYTAPSSGTYYIELRAYDNIVSNDICKIKFLKTSGTTGNSSTNSAYNRSNAIAYANNWWNGHNSATYPLYNNNDCANYVSQCLKAGGMAMVGTNYEPFESWFCNTTKSEKEEDLKKTALTWRSANYFTRHWGTSSAGTGLKRAFECKYRIGQDIYNNFSSLRNTLKPGDIVQYTEQSTSGRFHTLIVYNITESDILLSSHTTNSINTSLKDYITSNPNRIFTIIRIKSS